jgi:predicted amidohydrolase YtcJ
MKEWSASEFGVRRDVFSAERKLAGKLFRAGVPMLAGTDVGNPFCFPGFSLHDELALLVESGVTPLGALQMATLNPAQFMHATDKYGSVTPGNVADLVLLDADPLQDIHNTTKISEVFLEGKEYDRAVLDQILTSAEKSANARKTLTTPGPNAQNMMLCTWTMNVEYQSGSGTRAYFGTDTMRTRIGTP